MRDPRNQFGRVRLPVRMLSNRISIVFSLSLALALLLLGRAETFVFERIRQVATDMSAPVLEWVSRPVTAGRQAIERADDYVFVFEENRRLRQENEELRDWKRRAIELERRTQRFEALLNVQVDPDIFYLTGRVIGDAGGPFAKTLIVNVGRRDGANEGNAVIDAQGVVGRLVRSGPDASRVLMLTDLNSRVPVMLEPSGYRAIVAGDNSPDPLLEFLPSDAILNPGDRVVTSGDGGLFPPSLPVGSVVIDGDGYRVDLFADFSRLEFVRVLHYSFPSPEAEAPPQTAEDSSGLDEGEAAP